MPGITRKRSSQGRVSCQVVAERSRYPVFCSKTNPPNRAMTPRKWMNKVTVYGFMALPPFGVHAPDTLRLCAKARLDCQGAANSEPFSGDVRRRPTQTVHDRDPPFTKS